MGKNLTSGYLSKVKAAAYVDCSPRTLEYAVERGELPVFRLLLGGKKGRSRKQLFRREDLDAWVRMKSSG